MLTEERRARIIQILREESTVQVVALSTRLDVSLATVRRDLSALEQEGYLRRV